MKSDKHAMNSCTKGEAEGNRHKVKGNIKEIGGKVSTNPALETDGKEENRTGKVQAKIGEIKNAVGK